MVYSFYAIVLKIPVHIKEMLVYDSFCHRIMPIHIAFENDLFGVFKLIYIKEMDAFKLKTL